MNVTIDHPTDRPNFSCVTVGDLSIWFSYKTPIAFQYGYGKITVRRNEWGPTTGKHLTYVDNGHGERIPGTEFERLLGEIVPRMVAL